jgi:hypothetical protein
MQAGQQYEFSANQNQLIGFLARRMNVVGIFLVLIGLGVATLSVISLMPLLGNVPELPSQVPPEVLDTFRRYEQYARGNREPFYYGALAGGAAGPHPHHQRRVCAPVGQLVSPHRRLRRAATSAT